MDLVSFAPGPETGETMPRAVEEPVPPTPPKNTVDLTPKPLPDPPAEAVAEPVPAPLTVLKPQVSLKSKPKNIKEIMAKRKTRDKKAEKKRPKPQSPKKILKRSLKRQGRHWPRRWMPRTEPGLRRP